MAPPEPVPPPPPAPARVLVFGASGTIGRAVVRELVAQGRPVTAAVRDPRAAAAIPELAGAGIALCDPLDPAALVPRAPSGPFAGAPVDCVIACLASRSGGPRDAWAVDYRANRAILHAAEAAGVRQLILLSAICVQRPRLAFQHAKLAFERELMASSLGWTIVRPTAFFKSLSGQVARVQRGKPFLLFGDGTLTRCKPVSDADLARFIAGCIADPARDRQILPVGGPGPAVTPREQGEALFALMGQAPRFRSVSPRLFAAAAALLGPFGRLSGRVADMAEYLRIAHYYATESMLVLDPASGEYRADLTPETGRETLFEHYARLVDQAG